LIAGRQQRRASFDALPGVFAEHAALVSGADELRVVYLGSAPAADGGADPDAAVLWQRVDTTGAATTPPTVVATGGAFGALARAVAFGSDSVALLEGINGRNTLGIARVAGDGRVVTSAFKIVAGHSDFDVVEIARRGSDAVVLWMPGINGRMRLARVKM
jgi:hypothetical protein